ncbi:MULTISPECIES: amino acid permease [Dyella]|uniref:Arginine/agmatine antiporter n=2 Tax=Dyella TaxID=231454 RepID=A0A4R0Z000_9GAMM|nr:MULTISPECIES: amino acid permease [Dyella]TBR39373.1 amino acid permease [Dyella terrae]TCI13039.1 amino acid permease [Dyella soli]
MSTGGGKKMGLVGASSLVVANMVGTGLFLLPSSLANVGSISILGWIVAAIGASALGLVFAHLGMVDPKPGGPYAYARDHLGAFPAFQTNMLYWIANVIGNVAIAVSVTGYLATFFPALKGQMVANVTTAAIIWLFVWLNTRDASVIGKFTAVSTIAGILPIAFVGLLGWFWFQPEVFRASWNPEALPTYTAVERSASIALWAFLGVESAAVSAGVIDNPRRNVPLATVIGLLLSTVIYISCTTVLMGIIPGEHLRTSGAPFSEAARLMLGPWAGVLIALAAILKASGSLVGWILIVAQSAQAAAQDGMFPKRFGKTNAHGMPVQNLVITGVMMTAILIATASPNVATQFSSITDATVVLMALPYIYSVVAMWRLNRIIDVDRGRKRFLVVAGIIACMYCVSVVLGQSDLLGRKALIVLLATVPLYALIRVTRKPEALAAGES